MPPMKKRLSLITFLLLVLLPANVNSKSDVFTPLVASALATNVRPFQATDGRQHFVYELVLTNSNSTPATLKKIEVVDASTPSKVLATYEGQDLLKHLRATNSTAAENPTIELNGARIFMIDFTMDAAAAPPKRLSHHFELLGGAGPSRSPTPPIPLSYTAAPIDVFPKVPVIGAPLHGKGWVAGNGCCDVSGVHRSTSLTCNGGIYIAQRFAIDWMQLDSDGRLVHGDPADVHNYTSYGNEVLAVADGTVVDTLNTLDDQKPGQLPDPKTITIENVDGNHVVIDLGGEIFAFYAHLQKGSVKVAPGEKVKRGQVIGLLGNTGNTSAPHLHFHLMESPSVLCSSGIPYALDSFALAGQVPEKEFAEATGVEGDWSKGRTTPAPRKKEFPLDLNIVDFSPAK
jgi:Peptidase family M23